MISVKWRPSSWMQFSSLFLKSSMTRANNWRLIGRISWRMASFLYCTCFECVIFKRFTMSLVRIPVQYVYQYSTYTSTVRIPVQSVYQYSPYTSTVRIPVQSVYQYSPYTGTVRPHYGSKYTHAVHIRPVLTAEFTELCEFHRCSSF